MTFNFDRSFERVLFERVRAQFGATHEEARELATELQIHHVHGTLGTPTWLYDEPEKELTPYGANGDEQLLRYLAIAARNIRVVDEEIDLKVVEDIEVLLRKPVYVYFIGFGFDERNLLKLKLPATVSGAIAVRASALDWTEAEQGPVKRFFEGHRAIHLYNKDDALAFLRTRAEALFQ